MYTHISRPNHQPERRNAPNANGALSRIVDVAQAAVENARAAGLHGIADELDSISARVATIAAQGKPAYIDYLGDYDPSGLGIPRKVEARLRQFAPDADIHFERVAVTPEHIIAFALPTRPTKTTDSRSKGFAAQSVEVDAMASATLRPLVRTCITRHVEEATLAAVERVEDAEREVLAEITAALTGGAR